MNDYKMISELFVICATVIGCTWRMSAQITAIKNLAERALDNISEHVKDDREKHSAIDNRIEKIYDRLADYERRHSGSLQS